MGTITARKRKDNSTAYTAQIRINRDGKTVYQESQTFDRKQVAQAWIKRRETELAQPGAIERANRKGVTIKKMIEQYLDEYEKIRPLGKTKSATLSAIKETWLGDLDDAALNSQKLVEYPTDDVRLLTQAAVGALDRIFRPGFKYSKAEVMLLNLCQPGEYTDDLFAISQPAEATRVMIVMDQINERWGRGSLRSACVPADPDWGMRRDMMSQSYTTKLDQLWSVACR